MRKPVELRGIYNALLDNVMLGLSLSETIMQADEEQLNTKKLMNSLDDLRTQGVVLVNELAKDLALTKREQLRILNEPDLRNTINYFDERLKRLGV